jgi:hypothetical protein
MRNDYSIRPRAKLKKGGKADMLTAKMSKKKKGKIMKGKRYWQDLEFKLEEQVLLKFKDKNLKKVEKHFLI